MLRTLRGAQKVNCLVRWFKMNARVLTMIGKAGSSFLIGHKCKVGIILAVISDLRF